MHIKLFSQADVPKPYTVYKWVEGESVNEYSQSGDKWRVHTNRQVFIDDFNTLVNNTNIPNEERAFLVEQFFIDQAVIAGVVKKIQITTARNPNKWNKQLAPWFNEKCREVKKEHNKAIREYGKNS